LRRNLLFWSILAIPAFLTGCSGTKPAPSSSQPQNPPPVSSVTVAPSSGMLNKGGSQAFTAKVSGATDQSVFWSIVGAVPETGDSAHGFIDNAGVYVAPTSVPNPAMITVKATSAADATKSGTASLTIQARSSVSVTISPPGSANVPTFGSMQFTATVTGNANTAVTWKVNGVAGGSSSTGTVSTTGLFHAPNSVPVLTTGNNSGQTSQVLLTAVSQADATASDSVLVTIVPPQQNARSFPTPLGVSGGNAKDSSTSGSAKVCCGGTLGSLVLRGGKQFILSNNHVLADSDLATIGDPIVQPGLIDNNCAVPPTVASLSQFFNLENGLAPKVDAAIAQVGAGTVDPLGTILQLGGANSNNQPTDGPPHAGSGVTPTVGHGVAKSGRSTGLTCSTIFATKVTTSVQYQKGCGTGSTFSVTYTDEVDITNGGFSAEGDSGSLVVTQDSAEAVGLLFAGSDQDTVANPIADVLNALADPSNPSSKPVLVGAATHPVAACSLPGPQSAMAARLALSKVVASSDALQVATASLNTHAPEILAHPEVQAAGVGASYDNPAEAAILFFVTKGQPRTNIPAQVDGIRTRIIEGDLFATRGALSAEESAALEESAAPPQLVYSISDAEVARAKVVHAAHADEWMKKSGVQGVGISSSVDSPGEAALIIFLLRGVAHDPIPPVIDGLRTRVRESSRFRAGFGDAQPRRACSLPTTKSARSTDSAAPQTRQ
jgi:hypothetical protein